MRQRANRPRREKPWPRTRVVLPRPGVSEVDTRGPNWREMVFSLGGITDPNVQRGYRPVCTAGVGLFSCAARAASYNFPPASEENSSRATPGSDSHLAPEAWCSRKGTLHAQRVEDWCSQKGTLQTHKCSTRRPTGWHRRYIRFLVKFECIIVFPANERRRFEPRNQGFSFASCSRGLGCPDRDVAGPNFNTTFDPSLAHSTDKVVLFWQPPSYFPTWSSSSFAVEYVPYLCAEQYMTAEKTRLFQEHQAVKLIMSLPSPSTRRLTGRGVHNFYSGAGDKEKQNAVLSGTCAKYTQNPVMQKSPFEL